MKILDPKEIQEQKSEVAEKATARVRKLAEEEMRLVSNVNSLRIEEKKQKDRTLQAMNEADLPVKKSILAQEVEYLEKRKKEALKPIDEKQNEFKEREKEIQREKYQLIVDREILASERENLSERLEDIIDSEEENKRKSDALNSREAGIAKAEEEIKRSTEELGNKWVELHKASMDLNEKIRMITEKEINLITREKAIDVRVVELSENAKMQYNKDIEIKDKYKALQEAVEESRKKRNI